MTNENSGSAGDAREWLPLEEAASVLGASPRSVRTWVYNGLLQPRYDGRKTFVCGAEVVSLAALMRTSIDVPTALKIAQQALATSRRASDEIHEMRALLGLDRRPLDTSEAGVLDLVVLARTALASSDPIEPREVRAWADRFFGLDESYLALVGSLARIDEPWQMFLDLGAKLRVEASGGDANERVYLDAARSHLRQVAYFHCRSRCGFPRAHELFGDDVRERVFRAAAIAEKKRAAARKRKRRRRAQP